MSPQRPTRGQSLRHYAGVSLILSLLGAATLWLVLGATHSIVLWLACWLVAVNLVTFGLFGFDKARARQGRERVPELVLHGLSGVGGSLGAALAMAWFRHKTMKGSFRILFGCIVMLQAAALGWLAKAYWWT